MTWETRKSGNPENWKPLFQLLHTGWENPGTWNSRNSKSWKQPFQLLNGGREVFWRPSTHLSNICLRWKGGGVIETPTNSESCRFCVLRGEGQVGNPNYQHEKLLSSRVTLNSEKYPASQSAGASRKQYEYQRKRLIVRKTWSTAEETSINFLGKSHKLFIKSESGQWFSSLNQSQDTPSQIQHRKHHHKPETEWDVSLLANRSMPTEDSACSCQRVNKKQTGTFAELTIGSRSTETNKPTTQNTRRSMTSLRGSYNKYVDLPCLGFWRNNVNNRTQSQTW